MHPASRTRALLLLGVTLALSSVIQACNTQDPELVGMIRDPRLEVSAVTLPDGAGGEFVTTADDGEVLIVYFGYTYCPDVCPTTLADLRKAVEQLGDDAARVDVAMVTVDPERDTAERLTSYIQSFFPDGHALRTDDPSRLEEAAFSFGAVYEVAQNEDGSTDVAHSSFLYAVDSSGLVEVQWPFGTTSEEMTHDLEILLDQAT